MIVLLRSEATRYSVFLRTELAEDLPQIMGDRAQLQQVIMNLIMNSIDAIQQWDFGSAGPVWSRMAAACGLPTPVRAAPAFVSPCPPKPSHRNDT
jgi:hypothetical protein